MKNEVTHGIYERHFVQLGQLYIAGRDLEVSVALLNRSGFLLYIFGKRFSVAKTRRIWLRPYVVSTRRRYLRTLKKKQG